MIRFLSIKSWGSSKVLEDSINQVDYKSSIFYLTELNDIDTEEDWAIGVTNSLNSKIISNISKPFNNSKLNNKL